MLFYPQANAFIMIDGEDVSSVRAAAAIVGFPSVRALGAKRPGAGSSFADR